MAATKISDVVVPEVFNPYVVQKTKELIALYMGGIVSADPMFDALANQGGRVLNMPYWNDFTGDDEVLADDTSLTVGAITAGQDIAALFQRGRAFGENDLAVALAGSDPLKMIGDQIGNYWFRKLQTVLMNILAGVFADNVANDSGDMVYDIAIEDGDNSDATNWISAAAVVAAVTGTMGDAWDQITGMAMHSVVFATLQTAQVIDYVYPSDAKIRIPTFLNKAVIVDDGCTTVAGGTSGTKYWTYFFGNGAIALGDGSPKVPSETDRDSLAGEDILVTRKHFILHPRGVAWQDDTIAGTTPTNAEAATADNWSRVWDRIKALYK
jgi:hypothetical protein